MLLKSKIQKESRIESASSRISSDIIRPSSLKISDANDIQETEADMVADRVMMMPDYGYVDPTKLGNTEPKMQLDRSETENSPIQMQVEEDEEVNGIQMKPEINLQGLAGDSNEGNNSDENEEENTGIQLKAHHIQAERYAPEEIRTKINSTKGQREPLDTSVQTEMESKIGADFSGVKVHTDSNAVQMSKDLGAKAFTHGRDIYFNSGGYNAGTSEGKHLLAHELTHTIQQGSSPTKQTSAIQTQTDSNNQDTKIQKKPATNAKSSEVPQTLTPVNISSAFKPNQTVVDYLDQHHQRWKDVPVFMGKHAKDTIKIKQTNRAKKGQEPKYKIKASQGLSYTGIDFLNPLREKNLEPVIALNANDPNNISGFISIRKGSTVYSSPKSLITQINKNIEYLGLLGIEPLNVPGYENKVVNGIVTLKTSELSTTVAGFLDASGSFGLEGERFTFELNTQVNVKGLEGDFKIKRDEKGKFSGKGDIGVTIANLSGKVKATYAAGDVTVQGSVGIESEKFSGKISIMVADSVKAKQTMMAELGVKTMEDEKAKTPSLKAAKKKNKQNQVVIGWGSVTARITPWLEGTAKVGVDEKGQVTIVGTIQVPSEVILMKQKGKKVDLFELEIKAGYGIPLVGQVGLFASVGMFVTAGFGPLVLRNVKFEGTYSTDPSVLQNFLITGSLGISAFAAIGLEAKAGVFVTLIGHDVKAGIKVTAMAGLKAYAEVTPLFEYIEKKSPEGGKVGEAWLKGHFEAAAQLFLKLAGAFFVELDSPWWSPVPDNKWEHPLGDVEYPLGPSMGIGGDVNWLVGSSDVPELKFTPVDFDPDKFTSDIMSDPPKSKGGGKGGEQKGEGKWEDKASKGGKKSKPDVKKDNKGLKGKKKEDPSKWPDEKRFMRALGKIGSIGDASKKQTITYNALDVKLKQIKQQYRINQITPKNKKDDSVKIYVKHAKQNNGRHLIEVKLMSEAERKRLVAEAVKDIETKQASKVDLKLKTIKEVDAKAVASAVAAKHKVVEAINVVDGKETWDYAMDLGDKKEKVKGSLKAQVPSQEGSAVSESVFGLSSKIKADGGHNLKIEGDAERIILKVYSNPKTLNQVINDKRIEIHENKGLDPDYEAKNNALKDIDILKKTLGRHVGAYKRAVNKAYKGGKKSDITTAYGNVKTILDQIAAKLSIIGVEPKDWVRPDTKVLKSTVNGMAKRVIAQPLTSVPGNTAGSKATANPVGWESIDVGSRSRGEWVRAHLLSHKLHGPGDQVWNLFPGTREMNLDNMEKKVESDAKKRVGNKEVLFYNVVLTYGHSGTFKFIPSEVYMEYGQYDNVGKKRGVVHDRLTFKQSPPSGTAAALNDLNSSSAKSLTLVAEQQGISGMHGFFVNICKGRKNKKYVDKADQIKDRMKKEKYYTANSTKLDSHIANLSGLLKSGNIIV